MEIPSAATANKKMPRTLTTPIELNCKKKKTTNRKKTYAIQMNKGALRKLASQAAEPCHLVFLVSSIDSHIVTHQK